MGTGPGTKGFGFAFYHFAWQAADLLYPPVCACCGKAGARFCETCASQVMPIASPICETCGAPVRPGESCMECAEHPPKFDKLRSWAAFSGPLREALHSLKYKSNLGLGEFFAEPLVRILKTEAWDFDAIIPIPLSKNHLRQRGYNQAQIIAKPISLLMGKILLENAVVRIKETTSQVALSPQERYSNLRDAFLVNPAKLKARRVLVVDDVATTGATLNSCSEALKAAGIDKVYCITVAKALRKDHSKP
jgi:ComF family protein